MLCFVGWHAGTWRLHRDNLPHERNLERRRGQRQTGNIVSLPITIRNQRNSADINHAGLNFFLAYSSACVDTHMSLKKQKEKSCLEVRETRKETVIR